MRVFELSSRTRALPREKFETEWELESILHVNPEIILNEPLLIFGRQYGLDTGIPDLLALDQWGNVVVVEIKRGRSGSGSASEGSILSQPQTYAGSLSSYKYDDLTEVYTEYKSNIRSGKWDVDEVEVGVDSLIEAHAEQFGTGIDQSAFNQHQRMVILSEEITGHTENNANHLVREGLPVQCVEVQWFEFPDGSSGDEGNSLLVSSTVVDYPKSRIQPEDNTVDYSDLLAKVRDQVYPDVAEMARFESPTDMHRSGSRKLEFASRHPDHPNTVRYRFIPRLVEAERATVGISLWGSDEEEKRQVREVVASHAGQLEGYDETDEPTADLVGTVFEITNGEADENFVRDVADELVRLMEFYHPKLVSEVSN
jgi:hypothetical protein